MNSKIAMNLTLIGMLMNVPDVQQLKTMKMDYVEQK